MTAQRSWRFVVAAAIALIAGYMLVHSPFARSDAQCQGTVQVTNTDTGSVAGVVGSQLNSDGEYVVAGSSAPALTVAVGPGGDLTATNSSNTTYPDVGGIQGYYTAGPDLAPGSDNYAYLGATGHTAAASPPVNADNSYSDATGMPRDIESGLWVLGTDDALTPTWINSGGSAATTHLVEIQGVLVLTGDPTALSTELQSPATHVALTLVPANGDCDELALHDVPGDIDTRATGTSGATVSYSDPTATINGSDATSATIACTPASGSAFPLGATTVTCTGSDPNATNSPVHAGFTVTVADLQITNIPADVSTPATSSSGARVDYTPPSAIGGPGVTPAPTVTCTPAPGATFPIGATRVNCSATDGQDVNSPVNASFTVTVSDDQLGLSNVPGPIATPATSAAGATVTYALPTATDLAHGSAVPTVACTPTSGTTFPAGTTIVTCTGTDPDDFNSPVSATFPVSVGAVPQSTALPALSGTATAGSVLTCVPGSWTDFPTGYAYQWNHDGTPIAGATGASYTVATTDQGASVSCTVVAINTVGTSAPATSAPASVMTPVVSHCPTASGTLSGDHLGPVTLGLTRQQAQRAFAPSSHRGRRYEDFFCLTPVGIRVGYASPQLLRLVPAAKRRHLRNRVVWVSTANVRYALDGVRPDATVKFAAARLTLARPFQIGRNTWYLIPGRFATAVLKTRHGVVEEIGIADRSLTTGSRARQRSFLSSFS